MSEEDIKKAGFHPADTNGDGTVSEEEQAMYLEFKRKEMEDADAQRDAIRKMAWFALFGLLLYPIGIFITSAFGLSEAAGLIADIAPTYFASIAVLVSAFFGADALKGKQVNQHQKNKVKGFCYEVVEV